VNPTSPSKTNPGEKQPPKVSRPRPATREISSDAIEQRNGKAADFAIVEGKSADHSNDAAPYAADANGQSSPQINQNPTSGSDSAASETDASKSKRVSPIAKKRTFMERVETKLSELSSRSNFWHRICSWIWLPFAYRSGIRFRREGDGHTFAAVLPFRRFNRNWYSAMAGAALLGNSEIAGGMFVFQECGGNYRVVCKELNYRFLRPCVGPAMYRMTPREEIKPRAELGHEFNVVLDMEVVQVMRAPKENRERRVGRCTAVFHVTPQNHGRDKHRRKGRKYNRK
jgi:hypothetical protein